MRRDPLTEIAQKRSRVHARGPRWDRFYRRIAPIIQASFYLTRTRSVPRNVKRELSRYIPIAIVGALEGYFRMVYAEMIDSGNPYVERARAFSGMKFDVSSILAIQGGKISGGELVAHLLPHNSFADIESNMSILLGDKFTMSLRATRMGSLKDPARGEDTLSDVISRVIETFRLRHIFCHELATKTTLSPRESYNLCHAGVSLALMTDVLVTELIDRDKPFPPIQG